MSAEVTRAPAPPVSNVFHDGGGPDGVSTAGEASSGTMSIAESPVATSTGKSSSMTEAAADLIRSIDFACSEMNSHAVNAAKDADEARRNARIASELASRFGLTSSNSPTSIHGAAMNGSHSHHPARYNPISIYHNGGSAGSPSYGFHSSSAKTQSRPSTNGAYQRLASPSSMASPSSLSVRSIAPPLHPRISPLDRLKTGASAASPLSSTTPTLMTQQHHHFQNEELLALSLELERTQQSLENEQMAHHETKSALVQAEAKHAKCQSAMDQLANAHESLQHTSSQTMDALNVEVQQARRRMQAAEADAEAALQLARQNSESRHEMEVWLQRALEEVEHLRQDVMRLEAPAMRLERHVEAAVANSTGTKSSTHSAMLFPMEEIDALVVSEDRDDDGREEKRSRVVRFADTPIIFNSEVSSGAALEKEEERERNQNHSPSSSPVSSPPRRPPFRSLVAAGRQLLQRAKTDDEAHGDISNDGNENKSKSNSSPRMMRSPRSGDRQNRLRDRLKSLGMNVDIPTSPSSTTDGTSDYRTAQSSISSNGNHRTNELGTAVAALDVCRNAAKVLKDSGRRLSLSGRWWTNENANGRAVSGTTTSDVVHLESLARHYCNSVELLVDKKQKELVELESLCALWEERDGESLV